MQIQKTKNQTFFLLSSAKQQQHSMEFAEHTEPHPSSSSARFHQLPTCIVAINVYNTFFKGSAMIILISVGGVNQFEFFVSLYPTIFNELLSVCQKISLLYYYCSISIKCINFGCIKIFGQR